MELGLTDKTALVTNAASPIGTTVAVRLIAEGVAVIVADRSASAAEGVALQLREVGGRAIAVPDVAGPRELIASAAGWRGGIDLAWVGDAATASSVQELVETFDLLSDHLAARGGGSIVAQSSTASAWDVPGASAEYAAMAAAVLQVVRVAGARRAQDGIRVNAVCPGGIQDPGTGAILDAPAVPLAGPAPASDVADVAAFLFSPLAGYTTGQAIVVDGGASII